MGWQNAGFVVLRELIFAWVPELNGKCSKKSIR